jgi:hypothetical protein
LTQRDTSNPQRHTPEPPRHLPHKNFRLRRPSRRKRCCLRGSLCRVTWSTVAAARSLRYSTSQPGIAHLPARHCQPRSSCPLRMCRASAPRHSPRNMRQRCRQYHPALRSQRGSNFRRARCTAQHMCYLYTMLPPRWCRNCWPRTPRRSCSKTRWGTSNQKMCTGVKLHSPPRKSSPRGTRRLQQRRRRPGTTCRCQRRTVWAQQSLPHRTTRRGMTRRPRRSMKQGSTSQRRTCTASASRRRHCRRYQPHSSHTTPWARQTPLDRTLPRRKSTLRAATFLPRTPTLRRKSRPRARSNARRSCSHRRNYRGRRRWH